MRKSVVNLNQEDQARKLLTGNKQLQSGCQKPGSQALRYQRKKALRRKARQGKVHRKEVHPSEADQRVHRKEGRQKEVLPGSPVPDLRVQAENLPVVVLNRAEKVKKEDKFERLF
jgi:predicted  nucleic acid-binding Zn-ribbon protein